MGGRVVEGARLESVFRLNRLTWVRIPPHPPLKQPRMGLFLWRKRVGREPTLEWVHIRNTISVPKEAGTLLVKRQRRRKAFIKKLIKRLWQLWRFQYVYVKLWLRLSNEIPVLLTSMCQFHRSFQLFLSRLC